MYFIIWYHIKSYCIPWYDIIWHNINSTIFHDMIWYYNTQYKIVPHSTIWYDTIIHNINSTTFHDMIWYYMTQYKIVPHSTYLYRTLSGLPRDPPLRYRPSRLWVRYRTVRYSELLFRVFFVLLLYYDVLHGIL